MNNTAILEMLNDGKFEELTKKISEEIYLESLKKEGKNDAKRRFLAMKRYFKYGSGNVIATQYPYKDIEISVHNQKNIYNCFCNGFSFVLTSEDIGNLIDFASVTKNEDKYFNIQKFINLPLEYKQIDLNSVLAEAKSKGYKYKKSEFRDFQYLWNHCDMYVNMCILDQAYSIISDGENVKLYYTGPKNICYIETGIGIAGILPILPIKYTENSNDKRIIIRTEK